jgi:hypothetical protein
MMRRSEQECQQCPKHMKKTRHVPIPGFGYTSSSTPQFSISTSHCPFAFNSFPAIGLSLFVIPLFAHGHHRNASPPTSNMPLSLILTWLFNAKPSGVHASMDVAGAIVFRSTSNALKSVCVSSLDLGPRSRVFGGRDCINAGREVCRQRASGRDICRDDARSDVEGAIERCGSDFTVLDSARVHCSMLCSIVCV